MIRNAFTIWLARSLGERCAKIVTNRAPDFTVGSSEVYLARWWLIPRNPIFNCYLHVFLRDDDDRAVHDHPWASLSLLVGRISPDGWQFDDRSILWEVYRPKFGEPEELSRQVNAGSLVYRGARFAHRLVVPYPGVMTIFMTGPRIRSWGFWCEKIGWRDWKEFTAYSNGARGSVGKGCDP